MGAVHSSKQTAHRPTARQIGTVREFNRFYTRQLGLLGKDFLGSQWTLTEVRVLYELAVRDTVTAREIARELRLDEAYLSRILAKFQRHRLLTRKVAPSDARQQLITLTRAGRTAFQPLDRTASQQIAGMLAPLAPVGREMLVSAMGQMRGLLQPRGAVQDRLSIRALHIGDIGWIVHRQGILYAAEYGWNVAYEALVAEILAAFVKNYDPRWEAAWIAELNGQIAGSVFLVRSSDQVAKLRLLYVEPAARGLGIGARLVSECVQGARTRGYQRLTLWTNDVLVAARRIYEGAGFRFTSEERHRSFGKELVGQMWELPLTDAGDSQA